MSDQPSVQQGPQGNHNIDQYNEIYTQPPQEIEYAQPASALSAFSGPPVVNQPKGQGPPGNGWMRMPRRRPGDCPPGLEYLTMIDQLLVQQNVGVLEANKFTIRNIMGQKMYYAEEASDCFMRNCCRTKRPFEMSVKDSSGNEVLHLHRPLACDSCCFPCCLQSMEVSSPPGTIIGSVDQEWSLFCPKFAIKNASGDTLFRIAGTCCSCCVVEFKVISRDGIQVGRISKEWSGLMNEIYTNADYFGITFPMDLDVRMKALMLGACFLMDAMFFESTGSQTLITKTLNTL